MPSDSFKRVKNIISYHIISYHIMSCHMISICCFYLKSDMCVTGHHGLVHWKVQGTVPDWIAVHGHRRLTAEWWTRCGPQMLKRPSFRPCQAITFFFFFFFSELHAISRIVISQYIYIIHQHILNYICIYIYICRLSTTIGCTSWILMGDTSTYPRVDLFLKFMASGCVLDAKAKFHGDVGI